MKKEVEKVLKAAISWKISVIIYLKLRSNYLSKISSFNYFNASFKLCSNFDLVTEAHIV